MGAPDRGRGFQVGDGLGHLHHPVASPGAETQALVGAVEQGCCGGLEHAQAAQVTRVHVRVGIDPRAGEAVQLARASELHPGANDGGGLAQASVATLPRRNARHLEPQVDTVEQRTAEARAVLAQTVRRAGALLAPVAQVAARARVHGRDEHDAGRERDRGQTPADRHLAVLQRLPQAFEGGETELRKLVEEQHAEMSETDLSGARGAAAADQPRRRDRVMRGPKGALGDKRNIRRKESGYAVDARDLDRLGAREHRHDARETPGEHGLAGARRPAHEYVVSPGHGDLESTLDLILTHDVRQVGVGGGCRAEERRQIGRRGGFAAAGRQTRDRLGERRRRKDLQTGHERRFGGVGGRQEQPAHSAPPQAFGQRQRAGHGAKTAVQAQFAHRRQGTATVAAVLDLSGREKKGERDGQVEGGAFFAQVGRREIDRDAARRELEARVDDRRAHALAALLHRGVREPDDAERRRRGDDVGLDLDGASVKAAEGLTGEVREHAARLSRRG